MVETSTGLKPDCDEQLLIGESGEQWAELPVLVQTLLLLLASFRLLAAVGDLVEDPGSNFALKLQDVLKRHVGEL